MQLREAVTAERDAKPPKRNGSRLDIERLGVKTAGAAASHHEPQRQKPAEVHHRPLVADPAQSAAAGRPNAQHDMGSESQLSPQIDKLCDEGIGVIVALSELPELLILCDRILVLCEGRLTGEFTRAEATEHRIMEAATSRRESDRSWIIIHVCSSRIANDRLAGLKDEVYAVVGAAIEVTEFLAQGLAGAGIGSHGN